MYLVELPRIDRTILLSDLTLKLVFEYYTYSTLVSVQIFDSTCPLFIEADPRFGPLFLAQICGRWRRLAISMSYLWSSIHIGDNHHPELLKRWLQRSGTLPLSLHLDGLYRPEEIAQANQQQAVHPFERHPHLSDSRINTALKLITTEVYRWRRLSLTLDFESASAFMQIPLTHAANLEELSIQIVVRDGASLPPRILQFLNTSFDHLPSLKRLSWESTIALLRISSQIHYILETSLLWERLNEVQMRTGMTMSEAVAFLGMCVNASSVAIECITNDEMEDLQISTMYMTRWQGSKTIALPKLKELSIGFGGAACDCTLILERFNLSSLHTLRLYNFRTSHGSCDRIEDLLNQAESAHPDVVQDRNHPVETQPFTGFQRLLIKDEYMSEDIVFRLISIALLWRVPIVNFYTRKSLKWEFFSEALQTADSPTNIEYLEDLVCGKWIGWGGFPSSSLY
jgi:hypothetical protein